MGSILYTFWDGFGEATVVVAVAVTWGYTVPDHKPHYVVPDNNLAYTVPGDPLHFTLDAS